MTYQLNSDCVSQDCDVRNTSFMARNVDKLKQRLADGIAQYFRNRQARINRDAFKQMLLLDDEILDDIGVTRASVHWASKLPIHQSAAQALNATKKRAGPKIRP